MLLDENAETLSVVIPHPIITMVNSPVIPMRSNRVGQFWFTVTVLRVTVYGMVTRDAPTYAQRVRRERHHDNPRSVLVETEAEWINMVNMAALLANKWVPAVYNEHDPEHRALYFPTQPTVWERY